MRKSITRAACLKKSVALAVIVLDSAAVIGVVGIGMPTALIIGKRVSGIRVPGCVRKIEAGLHSVSTGQPTQKVVEGTILHCDQHDVINPGLIGFWQGAGLREERTRRTDRNCSTGEGGCFLQKFSTTKIVPG